MKIVIGLTGSLKTGKSSVAMMFAKCGAELVDADKIAHRLLYRNGKCFRPIVKMFGQDILDRGRINRRKLAAIVFNSKAKLSKLNKIIHPAVTRDLVKRIRKFKSKKGGKLVLVLEVPLLFEVGLDAFVDWTVVVKCNQEAQIQRSVAQLKITRKEALLRIKAQMPLAEKVKRADIIIDNGKTILETKDQVKQIWQKIHQKEIIQKRGKE